MKILVIVLTQLFAFQALASDKVITCFKNGQRNTTSKIEVTLDSRNQLIGVIKANEYEVTNCWKDARTLAICKDAYPVIEKPGVTKDVTMLIDLKDSSPVKIELHENLVTTYEPELISEVVETYSACIQLP